LPEESNDVSMEYKVNSYKKESPKEEEEKDSPKNPPIIKDSVNYWGSGKKA